MSSRNQQQQDPRFPDPYDVSRSSPGSTMPLAPYPPASSGTSNRNPPTRSAMKSSLSYTQNMISSASASNVPEQANLRRGSYTSLSRTGGGEAEEIASISSTRSANKGLRQQQQQQQQQRSVTGGASTNSAMNIAGFSSTSSLGGGGVGGGGIVLPRTARAKFCHAEMIATINTTHSSTTSSNLNKGQEPVLLELHRLRYNRPAVVQNFTATSEQQPLPFKPLFRFDLVASSQDSLTSAYLPKSMISSTCLDVAMPLSNLSSLNVLPIATGLSTGAVCIHTAVAQTIHNNNESSPADYEEDIQRHEEDEEEDEDEGAPDEFRFRRNYLPAPRSNLPGPRSTHVIRPATAVAWKPTNHNHVAVAWRSRDNAAGMSVTAGTTMPSAVGGIPNMSGTSMGGITGGVGNGGGSGGGTGERGTTSTTASTNPNKIRTTTPSSKEYGCYIWDINTAASSATSLSAGLSPVTKLAHQIGVVSLGWILQGSTLVVGAQLRNAHLFDIRVPGSQGSPFATIYAHNFAVSGIEPDPHRPHQFATFCSVANEPVKIWVGRELDNKIMLQIFNEGFCLMNTP